MVYEVFCAFLVMSGVYSVLVCVLFPLCSPIIYVILFHRFLIQRQLWHAFVPLENYGREAQLPCSIHFVTLFLQHVLLIAQNSR